MRPDEKREDSSSLVPAESSPEHMALYEDRQVDPYADARMSIMEHLRELRVRVIRSLIAVSVGVAISWTWVEQLFEFLLEPLRKAAPELSLAQMHHKDLAEPFFVLLKTAMFSGAFLAMPFILYQVWAFIAPGLYSHEKKAVFPFVILSTLFFVFGSGFCYVFVMPEGYKFLLKFALDVSQAELMMSEYLGITTKLLLGFGLIFELPVFSMFLARIGLITHRHLLKYWRYSVVASFIIAAMLTPPDVVTQMLMAGPMVALYFLSIAVAWYFTWSRERAEAKAAQE